MSCHAGGMVGNRCTTSDYLGGRFAQIVANSNEHDMQYVDKDTIGVIGGVGVC